MMYALIILPVVCLIAGGAGGYFIGRYQVAILDKIRTLEGQARQPVIEPEKPSVTGGAYEPPHEISPVPEKKHAAGLVETKTPERLDWETQQEIEKLGTAR